MGKSTLVRQYAEHQGLVLNEINLERWREAAGRFEKIPDTAHQRLLSRLREYLFVGGMPEAVKEYAETGSLIEVQDVHRSIVETYQDDFSKYARREELVRLQRVFNQIPRNIGRKIKYENLSREETPHRNAAPRRAGSSESGRRCW